MLNLFLRVWSFRYISESCVAFKEIWCSQSSGCHWVHFENRIGSDMWDLKVLAVVFKIDDPRHSHSGPPIFEKLWRARSPPYRSRFLRPRSHFSAFFEIYKIYIPSHRSKLKKIAKVRVKCCWFFRKIIFWINKISYQIRRFSQWFWWKFIGISIMFRKLSRIFEISSILTHSE